MIEVGRGGCHDVEGWKKSENAVEKHIGMKVQFDAAKGDNAYGGTLG